MRHFYIPQFYISLHTAAVRY